VENQHWADKRIPELLQTPAAVRFLSIEPLLGAIDLVNYGQGTSWLTCHQQCNRDSESTCLTHEYSGGRECFRGIDWIIVGGESGGKRRDCGVEALVNVARQGVAAGVPVFVKQDVALHPGQQGRIPDEVWALKQVPASE
jgi:protein gp37